MKWSWGSRKLMDGWMRNECLGGGFPLVLTRIWWYLITEHLLHTRIHSRTHIQAAVVLCAAPYRPHSVNVWEKYTAVALTSLHDVSLWGETNDATHTDKHTQKTISLPLSCTLCIGTNGTVYLLKTCKCRCDYIYPSFHPLAILSLLFELLRVQDKVAINGELQHFINLSPICLLEFTLQKYILFWS